MADDAEYQMELDAEIAREELRARQSAQSASVRPLFALVDGEFEEIADQGYLGTFKGVFAALKDLGGGFECFEVDGLPDQAPNLAFLDPFVVQDGGRFEVLIVRERDLDSLKRRANQLRARDDAMFDRVSASLIASVVGFIESDPGAEMYAFARTIYA